MNWIGVYTSQSDGALVDLLSLAVAPTRRGRGGSAENRLVSVVVKEP